MKNKFLIALIIAIALPQITFAAWWNPITWWSTSKTENKTQVLENRIKELEKKLDVLTSTTTAKIGKDSGATTTSSLKVKSSVSKKTENTSSPALNYNYIPLAFNKILDSSINSSIDYVKWAITEMNAEIKEASETKDFIESNNIYNDDSLNKLSQMFSDILDVLNARLADYNRNLEGILKYQQLAQERKIIISKTFFATEKDALPAMNQESEMINSFNQAGDVFVKKVEANLKDYSNHLAYLKKGLAQLKNQYRANFESLQKEYISAPRYQPVTYPQIQMPKTTYCTMQGTGINGSYDIICN